MVESGFSPGHPLGLFAKAHSDSGGIASFVGQVRGDSGVRALELSHYAPITETAMRATAQEVLTRFDLDGLLAWHRVGVMTPGQAIVLVAAAAPHRRAAFEAVDCLMDHLKSAAWFWKRERRDDGWHWISRAIRIITISRGGAKYPSLTYINGLLRCGVYSITPDVASPR